MNESTTESATDSATDSTANRPTAAIPFSWRSPKLWGFVVVLSGIFGVSMTNSCPSAEINFDVAVEEASGEASGEAAPAEASGEATPAEASVAQEPEQDTAPDEL